MPGTNRKRQKLESYHPPYTLIRPVAISAQSVCSYSPSLDMSNYASLNLPLTLRRHAGVAPIILFHWLEEKGFTPSYTLKPAGNHISRWWVDIKVGGRLLKFGSTIYETVNPTPHLWCMGSPKILDKGRDILTQWLAGLTSLASTQKLAKADFDASEYGVEYQDIFWGETVAAYGPPWRNCERWCLVGTSRGCGWCPTEFVS